MVEMSFRLFHKSGHIVPGAYTAPRDVGPDELAVWNKVLALPGICAELVAKGAPTSVTSQVVSGMNYTFTFVDGSTVTVYHQPWTNTLQVTKTSKDVEICLQF